MEHVLDFTVRKTTQSRIKQVDFSKLEFGKHVSDHMLICDYNEQRWELPHIVPYTNLSMDPATLALHYGQTVFEGMKAFRMDDGRINIFRIDRHYQRFQKSLYRMCMPAPSKEIFTEGLLQLVDIDKEWVPERPGQALYIRPFIYASEAKFGVKVSEQYRYLVFTGPVPEVYSKPIKVKVETQFVRASQGGTGFAKCGGNYGGSFYPTQQAREQGYDQVLWTDARENRFIEESGMMNIMFVIEDTIITPSLSDTILDGVTRDSLLTLASDLGFKTEERPISIDELVIAFRENKITEAFGAGTAAVVAPIQLISINGQDYKLPSYNMRSIHHQIKTKLENIRLGRDLDIHGWNYII